MSDAQFWAELPGKLAQHKAWQKKETERLCRVMEREIMQRHKLTDWQEKRARLRESLGLVTEAE